MMWLWLFFLVECNGSDRYKIYFDSFCKTRPILEHTETKITLAIPSLCILFGGSIQQPLFGEYERCGFEPKKSYCAELGQWAQVNNYLYFLPPVSAYVCNQNQNTDRIFRFSLVEWKWEPLKQIWFDQNTNIQGMFAFDSYLLLFVQKHSGNVVMTYLHKFEWEKWTFLQYMPSKGNFIHWHSDHEVCMDGGGTGHTAQVFDFLNMTITKQITRCESNIYTTMWTRIDEVDVFANQLTEGIQHELAALQTSIGQIFTETDVFKGEKKSDGTISLTTWTLLWLWLLFLTKMLSVSHLFRNQS